MEIIDSASNFYLSNPIVASLAIATVVTIVIIAYDVLKNATGKSQKSTATVRELNIYPIKSCSEVEVPSAAVTPRGFRNDRIFQVVSKVDGKWKFCTPRDKAFEKLFHVKPLLVVDREGIKLKLSSVHRRGALVLDLEDAVTSPLATTVMGYNYLPMADYGDAVADWLGDATGIDGARLVGIPPGDGNFRRDVIVNEDQGEELPAGGKAFPMSLGDEAPFLLTTRESMYDLNARLKSSGEDEVDMRRFRPNIVIDGLLPWEEDSLKRIRIGSVEFHVWQRCGRCTMTTIDRDTLRRGGEPLKTLSTFRERKNGQRNFGMHLIPSLGVEGAVGISVGDKVEILEYDDDRRAEWMRLGKPATEKKSWLNFLKECPFK
eukprot:CAMPEP_0172547128 /NCGR_PEP_ID=MMETSP1067-20121228/16726_1 /TAXON_ID=265564 ORGANISM="Thalassiosira punctigera, Strain Tpunct2005C2" /NCGR_SAMPLE_ID=MMETSP1067 /ASSEMBLY_ACC=CAM_ASM_000444 /LENGTH=374 /DNA_ID=CAMNT_0013334161 /DNA_START=144 /DNA_END=1268 /DNA_ORIENTATION=+